MQSGGHVIADDATSTFTKFKDVFDIIKGHQLVTMAAPGSLLIKCDPKASWCHHSGIGELLNLMTWKTRGVQCCTKIVISLEYGKQVTLQSNDNNYDALGEKLRTIS